MSGSINNETRQNKLHENNAYQMLKYLPPGGGTSGLINNETRRNENNDYEMLNYFALTGVRQD